MLKQFVSIVTLVLVLTGNNYAQPTQRDESGNKKTPSIGFGLVSQYFFKDLSCVGNDFGGNFLTTGFRAYAGVTKWLRIGISDMQIDGHIGGPKDSFHGFGYIGVTFETFYNRGDFYLSVPFLIGYGGYRFEKILTEDAVTNVRTSKVFKSEFASIEFPIEISYKIHKHFVVNFRAGYLYLTDKLEKFNGSTFIGLGFISGLPQTSENKHD